MATPSAIYRVHQCSDCQGDTAYYCVSCQFDLCPRCKEKHEKDLKTIDHNVMTYGKDIKYIPTQEICDRHSTMLYEMYCEHCWLPVCYHCIQHRTHRWMDIQRAYQTKRQQYQRKIDTIRYDALFYRPVLLTEIKADKITHRSRSHLLIKMFVKAQRLYNLTDRSSRHFDFRHRCLGQKIKIHSHIDTLHTFIHVYEQSINNPIQFLSQKKCFSKEKDCLGLKIHTRQFFMTNSRMKEDVIDLLGKVQITERGNRRVKIECLLKLMALPVLHQSFTVTGATHCGHISLVTSEQFWVSDVDNGLILSNTGGDSLYYLDDLNCDENGSHTVNNELELIYINRKYQINKLSKDMKRTTTFVDITDSTWRPRCVYWSKLTGDILIGMDSFWTCKVTRYNNCGQLTQTIPDCIGLKLYISPNFITENNNGDIVVSDFASFFEYGALVVTNREGKYRFSYPANGSELRLKPNGICTDALSHILVCDKMTNTVHMLNKDGRFLSHLLIIPSGINYPYNLSYDVNTHHLWVGSQYGDNRICVFRYITKQDTLKDIKPAITGFTKSSPSDIKATGTQNPQQGNGCVPKLMCLPKFICAFEMTKNNKGFHINYVTTEVIWISDRNTVYSYDLDGRALKYLPDLYEGDALTGSGSHTVNKKAELIYIDIKYNIKILPITMETPITFIEFKDCTQKPRCVYGSFYSGDLLVGMFNYVTQRGSVFRYNQNGQLTQPIQQDSTGRELYNQPNYLIENKSGDVVVSDCKFDMFGAVVVTDREGRHRFSYTGIPPESRLEPRGICTDALSHILVCDNWTRKILMLDKDGQFLSHLLTNSKEMYFPHSLSYDVYNHKLLVGSWVESTVYVYNYLTI